LRTQKKSLGPVKMDIDRLSIFFEAVSAVKMNNKKESIFSSRRSIKKMNNDEESILAGYQPAGHKDPKPQNSHPTSIF